MEADEQREVEDLLSRGSAARFGRRGRKSLYEAPEFTKRLSAFTEAQAGNDVKFECGCKGFPRPTLRWYRDDEGLPGDERYVIEETDGYASLSITKVGKNDEAAYKCKAENSEGVTSTTGYLSVTGDVSDKPLSCQGRQSEHAVSNPPPLRTIIEQKSMEEREEDAYPQPSTSPVDEILEEAALRGHGWPAMLGLKKRKERRRRENDEEYDSGSDTSVESQTEGRVDREATPDADLVIDEGNLLPDDRPLQGGDTQRTENGEMAVSQGGVMNGTAVADQAAVNQQMVTDSLMQQGNTPLQMVDSDPVTPMEMGADDQAVCQAPGEGQNYPQTAQFAQQPQQLQQCTNNIVEPHNLPEYSQVVENNIVPNMQTAPAMASPNAVQMEFSQPQPQMMQTGMTQNVQTQGIAPGPYVEVKQLESGPSEAQLVHAQQAILVESKPAPVQMNTAQPVPQQFTQMPGETSEELRDDSPIGAYKPDTEKQKSIESGYSTEDLDAAIQQEAAVSFTETMEVPVVRSLADSQNQKQQQSTIFLGDSGETTPEVQIGSPVNLHVSLMGQPSGLPIGIQLGDDQQPQISVQGAATEPDGSVQQSPPVMVAQPALASPQVYQPPTSYVSLERAEVRHSPPRGQQQQQYSPAQRLSNEPVNEPQVMPQSRETVMSQQQPSQDRIQEVKQEDLQPTSAANPFRASTEGSNEEMLASYTRTFSSTIEEEDHAQEVGEPLTSDEPIVRHTDEIVTLARVETYRPPYDSLPFPWGPVCLLVTVSSFLAVAFEISPSTFVLALFFLSLISFRFIVSKEKPKED